MKEHNKKTLIEALSSLKEHEPPEDVWMNIERDMEPENTDSIPEELLKSLPEYNPPELVWKNIEKKLSEKKTGRIIPIGWKQSLAIAASLAFLLVFYWQMNKKSAIEPENVSLTFSQEAVDPMLLNRDWNEDEEVFKEYLSICQEKTFICEQPEFKQLQEELEELTMAKEELAEAVGNYGTDPELILQIKEIELERTGILKKMIVMLI